MKYLTNIDMNQNEIQNPVVHPTSVAPANPKVGQMYTDTSGDESKLFWYSGKEWVQLNVKAVPDKFPEKVDPSLIITVADMDTSDMEVGMKVPISYEALFNPGSYTYGPDTGVTVTDWSIYDTNGNKSSNPSGKFDEVTVGDGTEYTLTAEVQYTEGAIPLTEQGNPYPSMQIAAGTKKASTGSIAGFRKYFYGALSTQGSLTSDVVRSLTHSNSPIGEGASFEISIASGTNQVIIAFPSNANLVLESVIDTGAFGIDVYDIFKKQIVKVEGANGYTAIDYDVYVYNPDVSLNRNKYKVTISK